MEEFVNNIQSIYGLRFILQLYSYNARKVYGIW